VWRRILQLPFTHAVPPERRDRRLKRTLATDPDVRSAILTWAYHGCRAWTASGLDVPSSVRDYTSGYRAENDPLAEWLEVSCTLDHRAATPAADLRADYERWANENGDEPVGSRAFAASLKSRSCETARAAQGRRIWRGIALRHGSVTPGDVTHDKPPL
jgi:putative DNA primase/helicase